MLAGAKLPAEDGSVVDGIAVSTVAVVTSVASVDENVFGVVNAEAWSTGWPTVPSVSCELVAEGLTDPGDTFGNPTPGLTTTAPAAPPSPSGAKGGCTWSWQPPKMSNAIGTANSVAVRC